MDLTDTITKLCLGQMERVNDVEYTDSIISIKQAKWKSSRDYRNPITKAKFNISDVSGVVVAHVFCNNVLSKMCVCVYYAYQSRKCLAQYDTVNGYSVS